MVTKLNHSVVSIMLNIANFAWSGFPCQKFHDVLHISSRRRFLLFHYSIDFGPHEKFAGK